jgi:hypothetical protein
MSESTLMVLNAIGWLIAWRFSLVFAHRARRWAIASRLMADSAVPVDISVPPWFDDFIDLRKWTYHQFYPAPPQPIPQPAGPIWSARAQLPLIYQAVLNLCNDIPVLRELLSDADLMPEDTESDPERWLRTVRIVRRISAYGNYDEQDTANITRH